MLHSKYFHVETDILYLHFIAIAFRRVFTKAITLTFAAGCHGHRLSKFLPLSLSPFVIVNAISNSFADALNLYRSLSF